MEVASSIDSQFEEAIVMGLLPIRWLKIGGKRPTQGVEDPFLPPKHTLEYQCRVCEIQPKLYQIVFPPTSIF